MLIFRELLSLVIRYFWGLLENVIVLGLKILGHFLEQFFGPSKIK